MNPITSMGTGGSARATIPVGSSSLPDSPELADAASLTGLQKLQQSSKATDPGAEPEIRAAYQEVVSGTFYKMMMDALRSAQSELPYIGGGQTEKIFSAQFDQLITSNLSQTHGEWFSNALFDVSKSRLGLPME